MPSVASKLGAWAVDFLRRTGQRTASGAQNGGSPRPSAAVSAIERISSRTPLMPSICEGHLVA